MSWLFRWFSYSTCSKREPLTVIGTGFSYRPDAIPVIQPVPVLWRYRRELGELTLSLGKSPKIILSWSTNRLSRENMSHLVYADFPLPVWGWWWRWVQAPRRMVGVSASVIFPCTVKSRRSFLLAPAHPGSPGKRTIEWLCVCVPLPVSCISIMYL